MIGAARRILILGRPGAGKTTLARSLSRESGLTHIEIDVLYWLDKKGGAARADFEQRVAAALASESWIVEGQYRKIESLLPGPDLILILEPSWPRWFFRLARRDVADFLTGRRETSDLLWVLRNRRNLPCLRANEIEAQWGCEVRVLRA